MIPSNSSPTKIETIAGGASFAPSLWSLPADATDILKRSWYSSTALITAERKSRNCAFSYGVSPGDRRLMPLSVAIDQLLCFPLPLTPANGFSCSRQTRPCLSATFCINSIVSWLWSAAMLVVENIGAISCWAGATSLCSVLARIPCFHNSSFRSCINAATRGLIEPK